MFLHREFVMLVKFRNTFLSLAIALLLIACGGEQPLRLGIHPWIGYEPIYLARELGWLPASVELVEGDAATDSLRRLASGEIDAAALTLDELLMARAQGTAVTAVLVFDVSAGGDVVLARPGVTKLEQLAGRMVGVEQSTVGMLVLTKALTVAGLTLADVNSKNLPPEKQLEAWQQGSIDAVVTYEPTATRIQRQGAMRVFDSRQTPDLIFDVLAVRTDRLQPELLRALLRAHFRAIQHIRTNRQDALFRIAARQQVSLAELQVIVGGITMPNLQGNYHYLGEHGRLLAAASELNRFMVEHRLLAQPVSLDNSVTDEFLPARDGQ